LLLRFFFSASSVCPGFPLAHEVDHIHLQLFGEIGEIDQGAGMLVAGDADLGREGIKLGSAKLPSMW
jgi:hypothetical protein